MCFHFFFKIPSVNSLFVVLAQLQFDQDRGQTWKPAKVDMVSSQNIVIFHLTY